MKKVFFLLLCTLVVSKSISQKYDVFEDPRNGKVYKTITLGNQVWMAENLNVSMFKNGDLILQAKSKEEWIKAANSQKPAWCFYENDPANGVKYGVLYNWYAINDPRGLAPEGWHVPSSAEWFELWEFMGGQRSGDDMLSTQKRYKDDKRSGFSALLAGNRSNLCDWCGDGFSQIGVRAQWWSTELLDSKRARSFYIYPWGSEGYYFDKSGVLMEDGYSVRCVSDSIIKTVVTSSSNNSKCPSDLKEISVNNITGTARKYKAVDGHYYFEVKLNVKPSLTTMKYTTKIQVNKKNSPYVMHSINAASGIITIKGCTENDIFQVEGIYSCNTGRFKGPSATIYFRDLKLIQ